MKEYNNAWSLDSVYIGMEIYIQNPKNYILDIYSKWPIMTYATTKYKNGKQPQRKK